MYTRMVTAEYRRIKRTVEWLEKVSMRAFVWYGILFVATLAWLWLALEMTR